VPRYLEERVLQIPSVTQMVRRGRGAADLLHLALGDLDGHVLEEIPVAFRCGCSRERVEGVLIALGQEEVERLVAEEGQAEVTCRFCGERYVLDATAVEELFSRPA
jgi:molecular chaperone Hsp33